MGKIKIGLLPRLFIAIAMGVVIGLFAPDWVMRAMNCFRDSFGQFIKFFVPFIIIGLVTPAIADTGHAAGRTLLVTMGIVVVSGVLICVVSTWIVVGRLVRFDRDQLYAV